GRTLTRRSNRRSNRRKSTMLTFFCRTPLRWGAGLALGLSFVAVSCSERPEATAPSRPLAQIVGPPPTGTFDTWNTGASAISGFDPHEMIDDAANLSNQLPSGPVMVTAMENTCGGNCGKLVAQICGVINHLVGIESADG